jgi:hypothetical protein
MKYLCAFTIPILTLVSCHNNQPNQENSSKFLAKLSPADSLIEKFAPIINGGWIPSDYIEDLKKTKSPWKSWQDIGESGDLLSINSKEIKGDSLVIAVGNGGAGPDEFTLFFKKGKILNSIIMIESLRYDTLNRYLAYEITRHDTNLILYICNRAGTKIVNQRKYERAKDEYTGYDTIPSMSGSSSAYFHNKLLVSGKYSYTDSSGKKHNAQFSDFGKVSGIGNFKTYYVLDVFGQGPGDDTDVIMFDMNKKTKDDYVFKINEDTLNLYETKGFNDSGYIYGSFLSYKLIRQK